MDRDRQDLQEEYVEWSLSPAAGPPSSLTFTTEFPEYFEALADVSFEALVAGLREIMPSANPTSQELLGVARAPGPLAVDGIVGGQTWAVLNRVAAMDDRPADQPVVRRGDRGRAVQRLQERLQSLDLLKLVDGDFGPITERAVVTAQQQYRGAGHLFRQQLNRNPWNDGSKGTFCMFQRFNRLNFLFRLVSQCCVPKPINPRAMCALVSPNCVPERNSDPMVCATAQRQVQAGRLISLRDPVGIRILELKGRWQLNGQAIEINNPAKNQGIWQVSRGGQRGVLRLLPGLTVDSATIRTGAQVARKVMVGVDVLVAEASSFK
ncbi:MAG: peptidoglycan-binding protein [Synechococcales cyanobacterium RM1_1_8]|nr:peptidoglycan-binding protein [Synechococcales cyanobacterium RM1_1_8]